MIWASMGLGAVCAILFVQLLLLFLNERCELKLQIRHGIVCSKSVVVTELSTACVIALWMWNCWNSYELSAMILQMILLIGMAVLTVMDYKIQLIPNKFLLFMVGIWLVVIVGTALVQPSIAMTLILQGILGAAVGAVIFGVCYMLSRKQLGAGDVKLAIVMGLYMNPSCSVCSYLIGTVLCCVVSLGLIIAKKIGWKDSIPMVPFLTVGTWIALFLVK